MRTASFKTFATFLQFQEIFDLAAFLAEWDLSHEHVHASLMLPIRITSRMPTGQVKCYIKHEALAGLNTEKYI